MKFATMAAVVLLFVAPAARASLFGPPETLDPRDVARIKTIGVVSVLDNTLYLTQYGTFFSTSNNELPIADWNLNEVAANAAQAAPSPRFKTVVIAPPSDLVITKHFWQWHDASDFRKMLIHDLAPTANVDVFLVIQAHQERDPISGRIWLYGHGVYRHAFFSDWHIFEYTVYDLTLVDAKSGRLLVWADVCADVCDLGVLH
jgi:hypothetical protein